MDSNHDRDDLRRRIPERFELEERLGSGAFGVVYRAFDRKHHSRVALKTLQALRAEHLYRFKREFRSLADIAHPSLVDLYELVAEGDVWFFTMAYVEGVDFHYAMIEQGAGAVGTDEVPSDTGTVAETVEGYAPTLEGFEADGGQEIGLAEPTSNVVPSIDEAYLRRVLVEIVRGVRALHAHGKVHRDLKPDNVLVTPDDRAVILDFGLVTELEGPGRIGSERAGAEGITGTPRYLAPEMAHDVALEEAADWYSLGVMLYEVLTGRPPVEADSPIQELYQKNAEPPRPIDDFRTDVSSEIRQLCMDLLAIEPGERPDGREISSRLETESATGGPETRLVSRSASRSQRGTFVGREAQLERLHAIAEATVEDQQTSLVNVRGESGIGKTALVEEFLGEFAETHPEAAILWGRCYENESVPYKALDGVIDEFIPWLEQLPTGCLADMLEGGGEAVAQLFPVLRRVDAIFEADRGISASSETQLRNRAYRTLRWMFEEVAGSRPLIVFIDDVQWGDEDSVRLLEHLLHGAQPPAMMLLTTWRESDVEASPFLDPFLDLQEELGGAVAVEDLEVGELAPDEARQMAELIVGETVEEQSPESTEIDFEALACEARGNPLFVDELSRRATRDGGLDSGITDLDDILRERIDALGRAARRILEVVALAGQPVEREIVHQIAGDGQGDLAKFSALRNNRLVRANGSEAERLVPYHDRIRHAIVERLSEEAVREIHLQLARAFESTRQADPETVGAHFAKAGEKRRAADYFVEAAEAAAEALAFERAAQLLERALKLGEWSESRQFDLRRRLGEAHEALGRGRRAAEAYLQAAEQADDPLDACQCRLEAAEQWLRSGDFDAGSELLYEELESLGFTPTTSRGWMVPSILYRRWRLERRGFEFEARPPEAIPRRRRLLVEGLAKATTMFGVTDILQGSYFHYHALPRALETGYPSRLLVLLCQQAAQDVAVGQKLDRAERLLESARGLLSEVRSERESLRAFWRFMRGMTDYFQGDWLSALEAIEQAIEIIGSECPGFGWETQVFRFFETDSLHWLGRFSELRDKVPRYLDEAIDRDDTFHSVLYRTKMALLALLDDDPARADEQLERGRSEWTREGYHVQHFWLFHLEVDTALYRGDIEEAWEIVDEAWGELRRSLLAQSYPIRLHAYSTYGRVAAAAARELSGWQGWRARWAARRAERTLRDMEVRPAGAFADVLGGNLERAAERFEAVGMAFHARALQLRLGEETDRARRWMGEQGVVDPDAMARTVVLVEGRAKLEDEN